MSAVLPTPADRLAASREHLRHALHDIAEPRRQRAASASGEASSTAWLDSLRSIPGAGILIDTLERWWSRHPLHVGTVVALATAKAVATPVARRHPIGLVLVALVLGALFAFSRPWRWAVKPALFAGLLPQLMLAALKKQPPPSRPPDRPHLP